MINKAKSNHKNQIADLWCEAFGDRKEDVDGYLEFLLDYFIVYEENGEVCGMLSVLPVAAGEKRGGYIYAVATKKAYRGRGVCTKLLDYVKGCSKYEFLVLVPQSDGLFDFYKKAGFVPFSATAKITVCAADAAGNNIECIPVSVAEYFLHRRDFFEDKKLIEWHENVLGFAKVMYGGGFYSLKRNGNDIGIAFCFKDKDTLFIKELCTDDAEHACAGMAEYFGAKQTQATYVDFSSKPSAMVFPDADKNLYFGIALD